jgi:hypothetical protein
VAGALRRVEINECGYSHSEVDIVLYVGIEMRARGGRKRDGWM